MIEMREYKYLNRILNFSLLHIISFLYNLNDFFNIGIMNLNSSDYKHKYESDPTTFQINEYQIRNNCISGYLFTEYQTEKNQSNISLGLGAGLTSLEFIIKDPYSWGNYAFEIKNRKLYFSAIAYVDFLIYVNRYSDIGFYFDYIFIPSVYEFPSYERISGHSIIIYPSLKIPLSFYSYGFVLKFNL
jgi:hypothetical protein